MYSRQGKPSFRTAIVLATAGVLAATAACGRSSSGTPTAPTTSAASSTPTAQTSTSAAGDFGDLRAICGAGQAKGATARGVTDSEIHIGTTADAGAPAAPGLGQEFFDVADGFVKWCNAAGGINGRKIVLDKLDAKLFDVAQVVIEGCQKDFMLVGGGNPFDSAGVKPREACKLGSIPAYTVSPESSNSKYQVTALPAEATKFTIGGARLMTEAYPDTKSGVGIGSLNLASVIPSGKKAQQALEDLGVKVTTVLVKPALVANFRPYMEQLRGNGSKGLFELAGQDARAEVQAMNDVGWKPDWLLVGPALFTKATVAAAKSTSFPSTYTALLHLPFQLADQYPVMAEAKSIVTGGKSSIELDDFTALSLNAWVLWAKSATACGSTLTVDCVIGKAGSENQWTAGGMFPASDLTLGAVKESDCTLIMRLTPGGWVYDKKVTNPNQGAYNCDPKNVATVKSYLSS